MTDEKKGHEDLKEYADGWMTERKGTDAPGFLKLVIPIIGLGGFGYLIFQMYGVAGLALIYVVSLIVFVFRAFHED